MLPFPGPSHPHPLSSYHSSPASYSDPSFQAPAPPMDLSLASSSSESTKKRSRAPSMTSQKTDGDYAGAAEGDEKKKIKKTKAAKKEGKDGDEIREEKPRTGKACLSCRRQKMKCEGGDNPPCARCRASGCDCIFKPRANAAILVDDAQWQDMVERRLNSIEADLRAGYTHRPVTPIRSSSAMSGTLPLQPPSSSSDRRISHSYLEARQAASYDSYSKPEASGSASNPGTAFPFQSSTSSPPHFAAPPQTNSLALPPQKLPLGSPQITERFRSMADTLGLTLEQLQETRTSIFDVGREVDLTALTFDDVMTCWEFFHTDLLSHLWSFPLPPSPRPSKLLLAAVLATATLLHPSAEVSSLNLQTFHLLDLALSDLVLAPLRPAQPRRDSSSSSDPGDLDDIVGLCIAMTWLTGFEGGKDATGGRRGEMLMGLAWRMASDRCLSSGKAAEEHRKRVWELVQITELLHSSLTFSRPLLSSLPPPELPSTSTGATPPFFTAVAALGKTLYGFISCFSSRSFPSVVELISSKGQGNGRRDALGYQDEVVVKRFKLDIDEWAKKWLGVIASSNLGTSAFSTIPDPAALNFLVLVYHSSTLLGSIVQRCKSDGPTAEDNDSCLSTSRALLQVVSTNAELGSSAGKLPLGLLMFFKLAANFLLDGVASGKTSRDDLTLVQNLIHSLQLTSPPTFSPQALLLSSLLESYTTAQVSSLALRSTPTLFSAPTPSASFPQHTNNALTAVLDQSDFFTSLTSPSRMGGPSGVASPMAFGDLGMGAGPGLTADYAEGFEMEGSTSGGDGIARTGGGGGGAEAWEGDVAFPTYLHTNFSSAPSATAGASSDSAWPPRFIPGSERW